MDQKPAITTKERCVLTARRVAPAPPSIGSSRTEMTLKKRLPPPPPSIGGGSTASGKSSQTGSKRGSDATSSTSRTSKRKRSANYPESITSGEESFMSAENRSKLIEEQTKIIWIKPQRTSFSLSYDCLVLGRKFGQMEPAEYVYSTYCRSDILKRLMDIKYKIHERREKFYELRGKLSSFVGMEGVVFHNPDALRMANIDAMMGYELSNPKNTLGETLLLPNELLYFVDIHGAPGGSSEYFLWKKQWNAHGFGFAEKKLDWDLPIKSHYSAESFEAVYGFYDKKGKGDITDPDEVDFFMRYVRRMTGNYGAHICIANGGVQNPGVDEDRNELRAKYMIMAEFMIALNVLREGGHFVIKVYDMFTNFTVGLVYLMYRTFDSIAIYKPETCLPASPERYVLCKHRRGNRFMLEVINYLNDCLKFFRNTQRLYKNSNEDVADIIDLVPYDHAIEEARHFLEHVISANQALGTLQLKQTDDLIHHATYSYSYLKNRMEEIRKKAVTIWGIPEQFKLNAKFTEASTPALRAAKLVRPYPPDILLQIVRDGEQILGFSNMYDELMEPREWHFVPVGRYRGFFLSLGGPEVYRYCGSGSTWEKIPEKIEMCNNTLVYADIVEEIRIFECKQVITSGLNIIDAMILGGKDIRALPYSERNELCQKFAKSMHKQNRDDLVAMRSKQAHELTDVPKCLTLIKNERLKGGSAGPSQETIYPVEESAVTSLRRNRTNLVFRPQGFCFFKTCKGNGVQGDFLYSMQNRLYWRFTEDVNLDPGFDGWREDADQRYGPIHAATFIDFLKTQLKK